MPSYFVGDIQGCYQPLLKLLEQVAFDPEQDILYPVGDIVARGPESDKVARLMLDLGDAVKPVLGNHDLHLMAVYHGLKPAKKNDKLSALLKADFIDEYIAWLAKQPLVRQVGDVICLHAGWHPSWSLSTLLSQANLAQKKLASADRQYWLELMYGNEPNLWQEGLSELEQFKFTVNACTRMRYLNPDLSLDCKAKMSLDDAPLALVPWFDKQSSEMKKHRIIFGHWASLLGRVNHSNIYALDTGCVWGNEMTLFRLEGEQYFTAR